MPDPLTIIALLCAEIAPAIRALEAQRGSVDDDLTWALLAIRADQWRATAAAQTAFHLASKGLI